MNEVRRFTDDEGRLWRAFAVAESTGDYKGRFYLAFSPDSDSDASEELHLPEVRWNSLDTAERTLRTMSEVEMRRRLRSALGRHRAAVP
ncbi:MAG: hypothetical protein HKN73_12775 [Gemmatimonadetes bacterium]|nr:hypothetical protein [Gemmatimonadota bacterium]